MHATLSASAVFVNGFCFDDLQPETILAAAATAQAGGALLMFDVGPRCAPLRANVPLGGAAALARLLHSADVLLLTEEEAATVTGAADAAAAAAALLAGSAAPDPWVVVKRGPAGCLALTRAGAASLPAIRVSAMDTVGCGDSFAAAVALGRRARAGLAPTLALANAVGAATAMGRGAGRNVARLRAVRELLTAAAAGAGDDAESARGALRLLDQFCAVDRECAT
jgi:sugar/nucleoside kinase (ribokinase family)